MVKIQTNQALTQEENNALTLLFEAQQEALQAFITLETFNLLQRFTERVEVDFFLEIVEVMQAGRYFKRWARRLRDHGFTREDAKVLSFGSFGTREAGDILGADAIITLDQHFINNYRAQFNALRERLEAMTVNLPLPYCNVTLPAMIQPANALASLN